MHKIQTNQILSDSQIKKLDNVSINFSSAVKYIKKTTMSHSQEMKYLEQVKIMTDNSVNPDQVASIVLQN